MILNALTIDTFGSPSSPKNMPLYKLCLQPGMFSLPPSPSPSIELRPTQTLKHTRHSPLGQESKTHVDFTSCLNSFYVRMGVFAKAQYVTISGKKKPSHFTKLHTKTTRCMGK